MFTRPRESADPDFVRVPRGLLREVLADGCCPLHLRLRLGRLLAGEEIEARSELPDAPACLPGTADGELTAVAAVQIDGLGAQCLAVLVRYLPLADILSVRTCAQEPLQWAMDHSAEEQGDHQHRIPDRIRARLWLQRVEAITAGTKDESIFMTRMRSLADDALRLRMETEMQESLRHMEEQMRQFQSEVDRRLEDQESHVRRMVEERVQQELDTIMASEMTKIQAIVEERLREKIFKTFKTELRDTIRELKGKLDGLAQENEILSDAFAESNFRSKCLFWAARPPLTGFALRGGHASADAAAWPLQRRLMVAAAWHPPLKELLLRDRD